MANKLYKEKDVARIAGKINSYTGEGKAYKLGEMADGVDEVAEAVAEEKEAVTIALIERTVTKIDIPEGTKVIGKGAFMGCNKLQEVDIPEGVKSIERDTFTECSSLKRLSIPSTVVELKDNAIKSCTSLPEIVLPDGLQKIGSSSINGCSTISELIIPSGVVSFPSWAISGNPGLLRIKFLGAVSSIGQNSFASNVKLSEYDFSNCTRVPTLAATNAISTRENTKIYVPFALYDSWIEATNWSQFKDYIVPKPSEGLEYEYTGDGYRLIGRGTFEGGELIVPHRYSGPEGEYAVQGFGHGAFNGDSALTCLFLSQKSIVDMAFGGCSNLKKIYLPEVELLGSFEFDGATSLEYVKFGENINDIGGGVFADCSEAVFDFSDALSVPRLDSYGKGSEFGNAPEIRVPASLYDEWIAATNWTNYADYIVAAG